MTRVMTGKFAISLEESLRFAQLSGDYNPLHIDPVCARRTQFGGTVVHGIHALLKALDQLAATVFGGRLMPGGISATFSNPVRTGAEVRVEATLDTQSNRLRMTAESGGSRAYSMTVDLQSSALDSKCFVLDDRNPLREIPSFDGFPAVSAGGDVAVSLYSREFADLFPDLEKLGDSRWIADLLASTRIIGMKCPGMHSIYSGFKFRHHGDTDLAAGGRMSFVVEKSDPRFRMIRLAVNGVFFQGSIDAFFRPPPVSQLSISEIAATVAKGAFAGQRALVIGGSRGLGEITAKILIAGGADVTITYAGGREDAENVCREARDFSGNCMALHWDVTAPLSEDGSVPMAEMPFSHVYFFASPHITKSTSGRWNHALFERFAQFYVDAFASLALMLLTDERVQGRRPPCFLYPSSIFLDTAEKGFGEYCAAKAAGESVCDYLSRQYGTLFLHPRLPQLRTDQTSGLLGTGAQNAFPVMLEIVRNFDARADHLLGARAR